MKLLTYNSLRCSANDVTLGYPLKLKIDDMEVGESVFDEAFMKHMIPQLDWNGINGIISTCNKIENSEATEVIKVNISHPVIWMQTFGEIE